MNDFEQLQFSPKVFAGEFDEKYVGETEKMLGQKLPPDFLALLRQHNGGIPKRKFFRLGNNIKVIDQFLALVPDYEKSPYGDLDIGVVWSAIEDRLNDYLVPFCLVFPGDYLCFDYETGDAPKVVLWIHDRSTEDNPATVAVADSFREFLSMLIDEKEVETNR
jgi:hypothetical protein